MLWASHFDGRGHGFDGAYAAAVSPDGKKVFVTGESEGGATAGRDYATVAYDAATGARLWASRYNGPGNGDDFADSVAVGPDSKTVYVSGFSDGRAATGIDDATVAYDAATGARLWVSRYNGFVRRDHGVFPDDAAYSVAVGPDGKTVFVTGESLGRSTGDDYATVAYAAGLGCGPGATTARAAAMT